LSDKNAPSVGDMLTAVNKTNSKNNILILHDSNFNLAASQMKKMLKKKSSCEIYNAKDILTSFYMCYLVDFKLEYSTLKKKLYSNLESIKTCKISKSIKDGIFNKIKTKKNDYIGIVSKDIVSANTNILICVKDCIRKMAKKKKYETCIIFCNKSVDKNINKQLINWIKRTYGTTPLIYYVNIENYPYLIGFVN
jgi:dihydroxyacetone kinase-like predicted kinase